MGVVRVRLLGEMHVETAQGYVRSPELPGRQGRLVLAALALSHFPVPRDDLADVVWPDRLPKSWERDLSAVVSKIRALLIGVGIDDPIVNAFGCYQLKLGPDWRLDITEASDSVEDAETAWRDGDTPKAAVCGDVAVEMLRRPFFPGEDSEWISGRRAEIDELLYRALLVSADVHTARGMHHDARRYARRLIKVDPFRESGHAALIRTYIAAGDRASALQAYEHARQLLAEELGVPPGDVLEAAYQDALAADPDATAHRTTPPTGIVALLFTDLVGSVALSERLGHERDQAVRNVHFGLLRECISPHGGYEVKTLGDGLMAVFASSADAVEAAIAIQHSVSEHNSHADVRLGIRVGIHVGEPTVEAGDYFGRPVAVARRLCDAAGGGEILVSDLVRSLGHDPELFTDRRDITLKGMAEPTSTWRVRA